MLSLTDWRSAASRVNCSSESKALGSCIAGCIESICVFHLFDSVLFYERICARSLIKVTALFFKNCKDYSILENKTFCIKLYR